MPTSVHNVKHKNTGRWIFFVIGVGTFQWAEWYSTPKQPDLIRRPIGLLRLARLRGIDKMSNHGVVVASTESEEKIMPSALARSVQARLNQLGRNPFEAARKGGLERSFVNDILIGRKKSVRGDNIGRLATALDWTIADMMSRIDGNPSTELRRRRIAEGKTLRELAEASAIDIDRLERAEYG